MNMAASHFICLLYACNGRQRLEMRGLQVIARSIILGLIAAAALVLASGPDPAQALLAAPADDGLAFVSNIRLDLNSTWEALGPFPAGTREHPILSSPVYAFLANVTRNPDYAFSQLPFDASEAGRNWPSALGRDGKVGWETFESQADVYVEVKYPGIR